MSGNQLVLAGAPGAVANYIEDVFSTYLYTGNGSTQTITNNIDLSTKGGLVWIKSRSGAYNHALVDTVRGATQYLSSNTTSANTATQGEFTGFTTTGFGLDSLVSQIFNANADTYASWTFREQPKFFDIVTYTGNGASTRSIPHNLGSTPGFIITKRTDASEDWWCYHRSLGVAGGAIRLNTTGSAGGTTFSTPINSTVFSVESTYHNVNGATYVAYLFAHNAGGFGLTDSDNVISCGSYTGNGSTPGPNINLGYEPQWLLIKNTSVAVNWVLFDVMRGMPVSATNTSETKFLIPNLANAQAGGNTVAPTATGFQPISSAQVVNASGENYIYIAIRRGPMKTPTSGTSVYEPTVRTGTGTNNQSITGLAFPPDLVITRNRPSNLNDKSVVFDKLRGVTKYLITSGTDSETTGTTALTLFNQAGETFGDSGLVNGNGDSYINWQFLRAPGFFDVVCYTGDAAATNNQNHNLGVTPEMLIFKSRSDADNWAVFFPVQDTFTRLNSTSGKLNGSSLPSAVTSTTFNVGNTTGYSSVASVNIGGYTYVTYLFASIAGVSKVGSYTGTGTTLQVNCGFTGGSRFVLIKRTDSTGDWYVWDSARGIVAGNDPYLLLNSTAAEVTNTDYVDTFSSGFEISSTAPAGINANGGTYIFLAIA